MIELFTRPRGFFRNLQAHDPDWRRGLGLCAALGVVVFSGSVLMAREFDNQLSLPVQLVVGALLGAGLGFVLWLGLGAAILVLAGWEAKGWELAGWVCAPALAIMGVWGMLALLLPIPDSLPPRPPATDVSGLEAWLRLYQAAVQSAPIHRVMQVCVALCLPPMLWVLYGGLQAHAPHRALPTTAAIGAVALTVLIGWLT